MMGNVLGFAGTGVAVGYSYSAFVVYRFVHGLMSGTMPLGNSVTVLPIQAPSQASSPM